LQEASAGLAAKQAAEVKRLADTTLDLQAFTLLLSGALKTMNNDALVPILTTISKMTGISIPDLQAMGGLGGSTSTGSTGSGSTGTDSTGSGNTQPYMGATDAWGNPFTTKVPTTTAKTVPTTKTQSSIPKGIAVTLPKSYGYTDSSTVVANKTAAATVTPIVNVFIGNEQFKGYVVRTVANEIAA
jgi:hypothetical protein